MVSIIVSGTDTSEKKITQTIPYANPNITNQQIKELVNKIEEFTTNSYLTATKQTTEGVSLYG